MSVNVVNITNATEQSDAEKSNANQNGVSPELIDEKIRANLEPFTVQISIIS